jgi:hypothetical protein
MKILLFYVEKMVVNSNIQMKINIVENIKFVFLRMKRNHSVKKHALTIFVVVEIN